MELCSEEPEKETQRTRPCLSGERVRWFGPTSPHRARASSRREQEAVSKSCEGSRPEEPAWAAQGS